jgi:hypothetical protein
MPRHNLQAIGFTILAILAFPTCVPSLHAQATHATSQVPFVGCRSDGQVGPLDSPKDNAKSTQLPSGLANRLAYYQAENGFGVLAPRGWHCFSTYGSNGSSLFVSPEPISEKELFEPDWKGFSGPVVQVSVSVGDTSGRFSVARVIARIFPDRMEFVHRVIAEGIEPASSFPTGPYATDKLQRRGKSIVEFETPAQMEGLGSHSRLQMNSSPIQGAAILFGEEPSLVQLSMRLPDPSPTLSRAIMQNLEAEASGSHSDTD